jgi:hypothetical protein
VLKGELQRKRTPEIYKSHSTIHDMHMRKLSKRLEGHALVAHSYNPSHLGGFLKWGASWFEVMLSKLFLFPSQKKKKSKMVWRCGLSG